LCEIDNIVFSVALSERVRTRVEEDGRVELGDREAALLVRSKAAHVCGPLLAMLVGVWFQTFAFLPLVFLAFWVAGVVDAYTSTEGAMASKFKKVCGVTMSLILGVLGLTFLMFAASGFK
jgi:hypothetical protein